MMNSTSMKAKIFGITIAGIIAAAVALLYAPNSGEHTRQLIRERRADALEKTRQFLQETQQSVNGLVTRQAKMALDEASALLDQGKEKVDVTRQKVAEKEAAA